MHEFILRSGKETNHKIVELDNQLWSIMEHHMSLYRDLLFLHVADADPPILRGDP